MKVPAERQDSRLMRAMFHTVAPRYDLITRLFSYGMDRRWKELGVRRATLSDGARVLDLACGTGDFSKLASAHKPTITSVAVDLTERMLRLARQQGVDTAVCADAGVLPFPNAAFDCVFIGYGLRNFKDLRASLEEIQRVTRPGGLLISLDFFLPGNAVVRHLYLGYLYLQGAFWGAVLHRSPRTYTYIPDSLRAFVSVEEFSSMLRATGYGQVTAQRFILGGIALHWAANGSQG